MKSTAIYTENEYTLVKIEKGNHREWAICKDYDENAEEGNKWSRAVYFFDFTEAVRYMTNSIPETVWILTAQEFEYNSMKICATKEAAIYYGNNFVERVTGAEIKNAFNKDSLEWEDENNELFAYIKPYHVTKDGWMGVGEVISKGKMYISDL